MGQILLGLLAAYILYNFIFKFLIPVIRVTRQVKRQVRDFQQHANTQQGGFQQAGGYQAAGYQQETYQQTNNTSGFGGATFGAKTSSTGREAKPAGTPTRKDDYIDFEEIK
jgi:hypothetical protein